MHAVLSDVQDRGHARSTCRVEVMDGIADCAPRTDAEQVLADRLGFAPRLRLACQTVASADPTMRLLILDDDVALVDQRRRGAEPGAAGEERKLAILFSDIRGFTAFSEILPPHMLNRYFHAMGPANRASRRLHRQLHGRRPDGVVRTATRKTKPWKVRRFAPSGPVSPCSTP
jgi:hypothetical protein